MLNDMVLCEGLFSHSQRGRIRRFHNRGPPGNLAHSQQTFPDLAAALLLPGDGFAECGGHPANARSEQLPRLIVPVPKVAALILPGLAFAYAISRDDHGL
jgi:hypothetical protein